MGGCGCVVDHHFLPSEQNSFPISSDTVIVEPKTLTEGLLQGDVSR